MGYNKTNTKAKKKIITNQKKIETNQSYVKKIAKFLYMACDMLKKELKFDISNS